uniref:Aminotransferase class V domain-containing protein n=1 Tax=Neobodo designis TaxID=312471 RepID=A0A7S1PV36_NEODS|mmetsp:Transcript_1963/g.6144  ORF Transcript_1963/g.6144 Transcript_1963/m.6144 type:complete len:514 (+) Transcript_1963:118-1659(+)|eukprot:CAMPEP_0174832210 /NCGR_PEP_ID=MMETSP1114-20130205/3544_1 /TAXON_ID=312471 /ORGANISM="Neobodo designis, Strain CCAP 1951/1" /LENGTH=513 /DNA_ID=CAMNT_0016066065 /DNA_START=117 /DNA_END=1658 /DNA_ORIENTATION=-
MPLVARGSQGVLDIVDPPAVASNHGSLAADGDMLATSLADVDLHVAPRFSGSFVAQPATPLATVLANPASFSVNKRAAVSSVVTVATDVEPFVDRLVQWRLDTPGCTDVERPALHLNSAGASLPTKRTVSAITEYIEFEARNGGYEAADLVNDGKAVHGSIARLVHAEGPHEVALAESGRAAWASAFYGIPFQPGDVILTCLIEYGANYVAFLHLRDTKGVKLDMLPHRPDGTVDAAAVGRCLDEHGGRVRAVAVTHVPTHGGIVNPCEAIGREIRRWNEAHSMDPHRRVLYAVDACQSVGQIPIDVADMHCDILSATSRKFLRGPRGVGFVYVRNDVIPVLNPPTLDHYAADWIARDAYRMNATARRLEKWECSVALRLGLGAAVEYALDVGLDTIWTRVRWLAAYLRTKLRAVPGVILRDTGTDLCGIISFSVAGWPAAELRTALQRTYYVNTTVSTVGQARIDLESRQLDDFNRASVHYYNSRDEVDRFVAAIAELASTHPPRVVDSAEV